MGPPHSEAHGFVLRINNAAASAGVVILACAAYALSPFNQPTLDKLYGPPAIAFTGYQFLAGAAAHMSWRLRLFLTPRTAAYRSRCASSGSCAGPKRRRVARSETRARRPAGRAEHAAEVFFGP